MKSSKIIAGVDEVGRGSLVGSVYSAAVILDNKYNIKNLMDSKKINEKKRKLLANEILLYSLSTSIGIATKDEIDSINIHHATLLSMKRAVANLNIIPDKIHIDGLYCPDIAIDCDAIVKGDQCVAEISAASIVAKVARDNEMIYLNNKFEMYEFNKNKGYGTAKHLDTIFHLGKTIHHRESFLK
tara:strand:+ start:11861 stop:12415 length:555 start_codon:yes stop_codon:yes gene_type:complete